MQYKRFVIDSYKGIVSPVEIDVGKHPLMPIIGVNECGKSTILNAVFAFDYCNDTLNDGRHLKDIANLYGTSEGPSRVSAEISLTGEEFVGVLDDLENHLTDKNASSEVRQVRAADLARLSAAMSRYRRRRRQCPEQLYITRNLVTKRYSFLNDTFQDPALNERLARFIVRRLPYIMFFDDFRDSVDETVEITGDEESAAGWLSILNQLFSQTDPTFSVFDLPKMEDRRRKGVLSKVKKYLNQTLTREWRNFQLDGSDALEISIAFERAAADGGLPVRDVIKLEVIETDASGDEHYFFVRDRSKGFFWFFNFVMKLEFNPKSVAGGAPNIYLLDEPGSYLHASAQGNLCRKLKQLSVKNRVVYCTHSHYLLEPEVIPFSSIRVADKSNMGSIRLVPIHEHKGNITERRSAFQPVIDALQIKPVMADLSHRRVVIVEGIYDYYALCMFRGSDAVGILPSVGANSIKFYISMMIAWGGSATSHCGTMTRKGARRRGTPRPPSERVKRKGAFWCSLRGRKVAIVFYRICLMAKTW